MIICSKLVNKTEQKSALIFPHDKYMILGLCMIWENLHVRKAVEFVFFSFFVPIYIYFLI